MGVDFYVCESCSSTFADVGDYETCDCGRNWCGEECAEKHGLHKPELLDDDGEFEDYDYDNFTCKFCREEDYDGEVLLDFILKREGFSREDLISLYKKENKQHE